MRLATLALPAALAALLAAPASAEPYAIDPSHTAVTFSVDHMGYSMVHGRFSDVSAEIDFDPEAIENASVSLTIQAESVTTGWDARDQHIRGADFLDAEEYPEITFVSKEVRPTSDTTAEVVGDLTIKGVTREETFQVTLNKLAPSPMNPDKSIAGFTVTGEIDRTDYGVSYAAPAVGTTLPIRVDIEASPAE